MKPSEAGQILAVAARTDARKVTEETAAEWALILDGLNPTDCIAAVRAHFGTSHDYLMPVHIIEGVRRIRAERVRAFAAANSLDLEPDDADPDDTLGYLRAVKARRRAIGDGTVTPSRVAGRDRSADVAQLVERSAKRRDVGRALA